MTAPANQLQQAVWQALVADTELNALISGRIFDFVPHDAVLPYVSFGPMDDLNADAGCIRCSEMHMQIDVWSDRRGFKECKAIAGLVDNVLSAGNIILPECRLISLTQERSLFLRDPDGLISHGVLGYVALIERTP